MSIYGDGRAMALPDDWPPVEASMLDTALTMTQRACTGDQGSVEHAADRLLRYYDPNGKYAGSTFLGVPSGNHYAVTASDLWAVTTLEMKIPPDAVYSIPARSARSLKRNSEPCRPTRPCRRQRRRCSTT
jgi:hypothetical protein